MSEIGGYLEFEKYSGKMLYDDAIKLNSGRNCLAYLILAKDIKEIYLPYFNCNVVYDICKKYNVKVNFYHINENFYPILDGVSNKWVYLINYYGQISNQQIKNLSKNNKIIVDNVQAYFQNPVKNIDTIYTCRKFFGVCDGALLYTDKKLDRELEQDITGERIKYLVGRFEENASEYFALNKQNNAMFDNEDIKYMSKFTENLLHSFNYKRIESIRTDNFNYLLKNLKEINLLNLKGVKGAFMYPLYINDADKIRERLLKEKIYIPILWPNVLELEDKNSVEYNFAKNILPIPCDQRYGLGEMQKIINIIKGEN